MSAPLFDRRLMPARRDRAAAHLRGQVEADVFVAGERRTVVATAAPLRREPRPDCGLDTEALRGESVTVYEDSAEGWAWVQLHADHYVGYMPSDALGPAEVATHRVSALRTFVYPAPNLKMPATDALSFGVTLSVSGQVGDYAVCQDGFVWADHLVPLDHQAPDFVAVAEGFLGTPYLWGGKSSLGLDCSGLVQLSLHATGVAAPRDSDLQERYLGLPLDPEGDLRRGDLVFWAGHVGIMRDPATLLHANGYSMTVLSEPLAAARTRILAKTGGNITALKRVLA